MAPVVAPQPLQLRRVLLLRQRRLHPPHLHLLREDEHIEQRLQRQVEK
jgi:hypothetical protein